jgi:hypothetical protein
MMKSFPFSIGTRVLATTAVLLGAISLVSCDWHGAKYPTEPDVRTLVVHGVLVSGSESQEIIVEWTRSLGEGLYRGLTPLSGARVTVAASTEVHVFREDAATPGVYRGRLVPHPGERYRLRVEAVEGETATGEAVVPGTPRLLVPAADTSARPGDEFAIHWSRVPAAGYVIVRSSRPAASPSPFQEFLYASVVRDTTARTGLGVLENQPRTLAVAAVDSSFALYLDRERGGPLHTNLQGAYGLFGAVAFSNSRRVTVAR